MEHLQSVPSATVFRHLGLQIYNVDIRDVEEAGQKEMEGPGSLLGYRALHKKIREVHG